jgi:hypothetical protein
MKKGKWLNGKAGKWEKAVIFPSDHPDQRFNYYSFHDLNRVHSVE